MLEKVIIKKYLHTETLKNTFFRVPSEVLVCLFLSVVTFAVYWHVTSQQFVGYDDDVYVTENSYIQQGLTLENIAWSFSFDEKELWANFWYNRYDKIHLIDYKPDADEDFKTKLRTIFSSITGKIIFEN